MEWVRSQKSPWGQEIWIGLSWDLLWLAAVAGALLIVGHLVLWAFVFRQLAKHPGGKGDGPASLPARILRHTAPSRIFHWTMAISMLVLLGTAFFPILGWKFPWVTAHWIAGFVLTAAILFHVVHTTFFKGLGLMWINKQELLDRLALIREMTAGKKVAPRKTGKIPLDNKLFHHGAAVAGLTAIFSGAIMMAKVDTPWWDRNPYVLPDEMWGIVYILHGAGSLALVTLVMAHLYFALRPDKFWITLSMFRGWISRENYLAHHDPEMWPPQPLPEAVSRGGTMGGATQAGQGGAR